VPGGGGWRPAIADLEKGGHPVDEAFGENLHRQASVLALSAKERVRGLLAQASMLHDKAFRTLDHLSRFELLLELGHAAFALEIVTEALDGHGDRQAKIVDVHGFQQESHGRRIQDLLDGPRVIVERNNDDGDGTMRDDAPGRFWPGEARKPRIQNEEIRLELGSELNSLVSSRRHGNDMVPQ